MSIDNEGPYKVAVEEEYKPKAGGRFLGRAAIPVEDVVLETDEYYEFLGFSGRKGRRFIAEKLLQIEKRLDALEKE